MPEDEVADQSKRGMAMKLCVRSQHVFHFIQNTVISTHTDIKAPGKKMVVSTAITFIAELSCLLATASSLESRAIDTFKALSSWAMRLNNYACEFFNLSE
jgi:hypothetical protein